MSEDEYSDYSDSGDDASTEPSDSNDSDAEKSDGRIQFDRNDIQLQLGNFANVVIVPGPSKTFSITFKTDYPGEGGKQVSLQIQNGQCRVNTSAVIAVETNNNYIPPQQLNNNQQPQFQQMGVGLLQAAKLDPASLYKKI